MGMKERPDTNIMGQKILVLQLYRVLRVLQFLYNILKPTIPVSAFLVALSKGIIYIILLKDQADRIKFASKLAGHRN